MNQRKKSSLFDFSIIENEGLFMDQSAMENREF